MRAALLAGLLALPGSAQASWSVVSLAPGRTIAFPEGRAPGDSARASAPEPFVGRDIRVRRLRLRDGRTISVILAPGVHAAALEAPAGAWTREPSPAALVRYGLGKGGPAFGVASVRGDGPEFTTVKWARELLYFQVSVAGDIRGDGVTRFYGHAIGSKPDAGEVFELSRSGGGWSLDVLARGRPVACDCFAIADARDEGRPSLYAVAGTELDEFRWGGRALVKTPVGTDIASARALEIGAFRGDARPRIYLVVPNLVREYVFDDGWRTGASFTASWGIRGIGRARGEGGEELYVGFVSPRPAVERLVWTPPAAVAVADFRPDGVPKAEAVAFSEMLRSAFVRTGNCPVVERERILDVLAERGLQSGGATQENAGELGRLLGAREVVVGILGEALGTHVATVNFVSGATGELERTNFVQWKTREQLEKAARTIAWFVCPGGNADMHGERR